jgi:hypothetical protein
MRIINLCCLILKASIKNRHSVKLDKKPENIYTKINKHMNASTLHNFRTSNRKSRSVKRLDTLKKTKKNRGRAEYKRSRNQL